MKDKKDKSCVTCEYLGNQLKLIDLKCKRTSEQITPLDWCGEWMKRNSQ